MVKGGISIVAVPLIRVSKAESVDMVVGDGLVVHVNGFWSSVMSARDSWGLVWLA